MRNIKKYFTCVSCSEEDLDDSVMVKIEEGFQPFGSPYTYKDTHNNQFHVQAMVKYKG